MDWMYANCSTTAQRGALDWKPRFKAATLPVFKELYEKVKSGHETEIVLRVNSARDYREKLEVGAQGHPRVRDVAGRRGRALAAARELEEVAEAPMKVPLRSAVTLEGRRMAGARSLWRANGMRDEQPGRPVIAVANSFTQLVPGHVHLHDVGQRVKAAIEAAGCFAAEFDTIAIDDGIAMGHDGMLYSLPSRELIADSVEYMANAHRVDALVCISNCDKITPGMLMAAMRLNIPAIFVSGGPMEAGVRDGRRYDLVDAMVAARRRVRLRRGGRGHRGGRVPHLRLLLGHVHRQLHELPGRGARHGPPRATARSSPPTRARLALFDAAARRIVEMADRWYGHGDASVLPRSIASRSAFMNAMALDIAMGGSTNTVLHLLAIAREAHVDFSMADIDGLSRRIPCLCKVAPSSPYHVEDVNRAGGIHGILGELARAGLLDTTVKRADGLTLKQAIAAWDIRSPSATEEARALHRSAPGGQRSIVMGSQSATYPSLDTDRAKGCIRDVAHAYQADGGLAVLTGNLAERGCIVKTAGVDPSVHRFRGPARVFFSQEAASEGILDGTVKAGDVVVIRYEGPRGGPGHAGDALPDLVPQGTAPRCGVRPGDRREVLGRDLRPVDRARVAGSGRRGHHRAGQGRRPHRHRHPRAHHQPRGAGGRAEPSPPRGGSSRQGGIHAARASARGVRGAEDLRDARIVGGHGSGPHASRVAPGLPATPRPTPSRIPCGAAVVYPPTPGYPRHAA